MVNRSRAPCDIVGELLFCLFICKWKNMHYATETIGEAIVFQLSQKAKFKMSRYSLFLFETFAEQGAFGKAAIQLT